MDRRDGCNERNRILPRIFLVTVLSISCLYPLYTRIHGQAILTVAIGYSKYSNCPGDYSGKASICEIYRDGTGRYYYGVDRISGSLKDKPFFLYSSARGIEKPREKIPKDELKILLDIYKDLQEYGYLYEEPLPDDIGAWVLCDGVEYKMAGSDVTNYMWGENEAYGPNGANGWEIRRDKFWEEFFHLFSQYWFPEDGSTHL